MRDNTYDYLVEVSKFVKMKRFLSFAKIKQSNFSVYLRTGSGIEDYKLMELVTLLQNFGKQLNESI